MQRQRPSFGAFLSTCSNTKQSSSLRSQSNLTNSNSQLNSNLNPFPQTSQPTSSHPVEFYKSRQRLTSEMFSTRIGYRIRSYSRVQQDYLIYLAQLIMTEFSGIKVYVIEPNFLYFEMSSVSQQDDEMEENTEKKRQQIELEYKMFDFLKEVSEQVFNPWVERELQPDRLTAEDFSEEKVVHSFTKEVVQKIKQKHQQVFTVVKKSNHK